MTQLIITNERQLDTKLLRIMEFRELYFSQTETCRIYKISVRKFRKIIADNGLNVIEDEFISHTIGGKPYEVKTIFVKRIDFIRAYI